MKKFVQYTLLVLLLYTGADSFSQNQNSKWYFGNLAGLDFATNPPTALTNGIMYAVEGSASIADASGNLLFYTDGVTIYNSSHAVMANGTGLIGTGTAAQSCIIIKKPGSNTLFYVFTVQGMAGSGGFNYSIVDMSLAAGQGSVTVLNAPVYNSPVSERLTATRHCNGTDYWIVIREYASVGNTVGNFRAYLLTANGLNPTPVVSPFLQGSVQPNNFVGCMKISPDGKHLGTAYYYMGNMNSIFQMFDFDNTSGVISNSLALMPVLSPSAIPYGYGVEFSPDGSKFYGSTVGTGTNGGIFQWDLCAGSPMGIVASYTQVGSNPSFNIFSLQLAPNGKIYASTAYTNYLAVINTPNAAGSACNFVFNGQSLGTRMSLNGLPNFPGSSFLLPAPLSPFTYTVSNTLGCQTAAFTSPLVSQGTITACSASGYSVTGIKWDFGDPASGASNNSFINNPLHAFSNLGSYNVKLIVYYSCGGGTDTLKQTVNVNQPCISVSSTSITCASLGSATVVPANGFGPFTYTWIPGNQTNSVATNLTPGTYTILVHDAGNGFTYTTTTHFTPLIPLTGSLVSTPSLSCFGDSTGSASVINLQGGSPSQSYLWSNGTLSFTALSPNTLSAGNWTVTVTDNLTGCQIKQPFFIAQPPKLVLSLSASSPTACAGSSIVLNGTVSGGTPGYTYTWSPSFVSGSHTVSESIAGTYVYTLHAGDAHSCAVSNSISVVFVPNPTLTVSNVSICPLDSATLYASGAVSYSWNTGSLLNFITDGPSMTRQYTVTGTALGCSSMATAKIVVKLTPIAVINSNSPKCSGSSLNIQALGGSSFLWSGPNNFTSSAQSLSFNPVMVSQDGVYSVTLTAANGCTATLSKTITVYPAPVLSALGSTVCTSQVLSLFANALSSYTYAWTGPQNFSSTVQNPSIPSPSVSQSGNYTVVVSDAKGCSSKNVVSALVVPPPSLTLSLSSNGTLCAQAFNGSPNTITLTSSGAASYSLFTPSHISNPNPSGPVSPLATAPPYSSGIATATLLGSNGVCSVSVTTSFSILPNPTLSINSPTPVICAGESYTYTNQGAASYTWGPGTPGLSTYTGPSTVASPTVTSVFSVVGGSLGCNSSTQTSTITVNPLPVIAVANIHPTVCIGGQVALTAFGTSSSYTWQPYAGLSTNQGSLVMASPAALQTYTVTGSLNSCTRSAMVTVSVLPLPAPVASALQPSVCLNEPVTLAGSGGIGYQWTGPGNLIYAGKTVSFVASNPAFAGTYTLTVTDSNSCKSSATTQLDIFSLPEGYLTASTWKGCVPFRSDFEFHPSPMYPSAISSRWQLNATVFDTSSFTYPFKTAGIYTLTGTLKDPLTGCRNSKLFYVEAYPIPVADFSFSPEHPVENLDPVIFTNTSRGEALSYWNWYFINNQGYRSEQQHTSYLFTGAGNYPVAMKVTNAWGCSDTIVKALSIGADVAIYIPDAFSPNGDERNDLFFPVMRGIRNAELRIFDRWGTLLFHSSDLQGAWDGSFKGQPCKNDVYIWKIEVSTITGEMKALNGHVTLMR